MSSTPTEPSAETKLTEIEKLFNLVLDDLQKLQIYVNSVLDSNDLDSMWDTFDVVHKAKEDVRYWLRKAGEVNDEDDE